MENFKDYSQHGEGKWLFDYLGKPRKGIMVDIGAHDGITNSNSNIFAQAGFKIVYFEPNPVTFCRLFSNTSNFKRELYNIAISDRLGKSSFDIVTRKNFEGHSKLSESGKHTVLKMPLSIVFSENADILSIDAEGHDTEILSAVLHDGFTPRIIIIEANDEINKSKQAELLTQYGYRKINQFKVNTIWEKS